MTIEKFLSFWSHYNTAIIEGLVALIIIASLYLAFRSFFGKSVKGEASAERPSEANAAEIEKTLQKILENQSKVGSAPRTSVTEDLGMAIDLNHLDNADSRSGAVMESPAEVSQLRLTLNETHKKIEVLQAQLEEAQQKAAQATEAAAAASAAPSAGGDAGISAQEKEDLAGKIRDLEARLAEYEIISEDIADLSKYREENEQLRNELAAAKAGGGATVAEPVPAPAPVEPPAEVPAEVAGGTEALMEDLFGAGAPAAVPEAEAPSAELIDEDLMKEFAAAVEGQKAAAASEKAAAAAEKAEAGAPVVAVDDTEKLMNEFENFVSKKS